MFMTHACKTPAASRVCGTTMVRYLYQRDAELIYPFYTKLTSPICKLNGFLWSVSNIMNLVDDYFTVKNTGGGGGRVKI